MRDACCRKVFGGYVDINVRMGASVMRQYFKELKVDGSWLSQKPQQTLLTGAHQASGLPATLASNPVLTLF